jgi:predicted Zn finger-like uncharacterized protein
MVFQCNICGTALSADESQAGQLVRCPKCLTTLRVPAMQREMAAAGAGAGTAAGKPLGRPGGTPFSASPRAGGRRFGFNCGYCSSRLEATENQSGQEGQCPTCGNAIVIPILDRYGRLIDPMTGKIIKPDPHPVHAYAAAGERAPRILRSDDGRQTIVCPRCQAMSPISANNCKSCGMPFTMEGTTLEASGTSNGFCVASLVLGIISLPAFCAVIPAVLAIIFGVIGYNQVSKSGAEGGGKGMAIAGAICGVASGVIFILVNLR